MAKILIADDDRSMCQFLALALERAGHEVIAAHDGLDALERVKEHAGIDLLLSDIVMPGMDGIELSQNAKRIHPNLKTLFITGFSAIAAGTGDQSPVMSKPFHLNDLIGQVEALLNTQPKA